MPFLIRQSDVEQCFQFVLAPLPYKLLPKGNLVRIVSLRITVLISVIHDSTRSLDTTSHNLAQPVTLRARTDHERGGGEGAFLMSWKYVKLLDQFVARQLIKMGTTNSLSKIRAAERDGCYHRRLYVYQVCMCKTYCIQNSHLNSN